MIDEFSITVFKEGLTKVQPLLIKSTNKIKIDEGYIDDKIKNQIFTVDNIELKLLNKYPTIKMQNTNYFSSVSIAFFNVSFLTFLIRNQNKN